MQVPSWRIFLPAAIAGLLLVSLCTWGLYKFTSAQTEKKEKGTAKATPTPPATIPAEVKTVELVPNAKHEGGGEGKKLEILCHSTKTQTVTVTPTMSKETVTVTEKPKVDKVVTVITTTTTTVDHHQAAIHEEPREDGCDSHPTAVKAPVTLPTSMPQEIQKQKQKQKHDHILPTPEDFAKIRPHPRLFDHIEAMKIMHILMVYIRWHM